MTRTPPAPRMLRADAQRNRQRVLEVAEQVFASEGLDVPIDEIARRAGMGVGTIYRHFPTKQALFAAITSDRMTRMADQATALADAEDPARAFFALLELLSVEFRRKKDFGPAMAGIDVHELIAESKARLRAAMTRLLHRAHAAGAVRDGMVYEELIALVSATVPSPDRPACDPVRLLAIICDGLRPPPVTAPPPTRPAVKRPAAKRKRR